MKREPGREPNTNSFDFNHAGCDRENLLESLFDGMKLGSFTGFVRPAN